MSERSELEIALENNDLNKIKEFIKTGGNVYKAFENPGYYVRGGVRENLMSRACKENKTEIVEILLDVYEKDYKIAEKFVNSEENKEFLLKYIFIASTEDEIKEVLHLHSKKFWKSSRKCLIFLADRQECVIVSIVEDKNLMFKLYQNGFLSINCRAAYGECPGSFVGAIGRLDLLKRMIGIGLNLNGLFPGVTQTYDHYFIESIINKSNSIEVIKYCLTQLNLDHEDLLKFTEKNQNIEVFEYVLEYLCSKTGCSKLEYIQTYCKENVQFIENCLNSSQNYVLVAHIFTVYKVIPNFDDILDKLNLYINTPVVAAVWEALDKNTLKKINKNYIELIIVSHTKEYFDMVDPLAIYDEENGNTALFIALQQNCEPLVSHLISNGADLLHKNKEGHTTLTIACKYCTPEIIGMLMKTDSRLIHEVGNYGCYPLTELTHRGDSFVNVFKEMLKTGANVHILNNENYSLLHYAVLNHNLELVKICLDVGIDPSLKTSNGNTALHLSAIGENLEIFDLLLKTGNVDIETKNDQGNTILHNVCQSYIPGFFLSFIEKTKPNVNALNNAGQSPIYFCFDIVSFEKLLEMGADLTIIGEKNLPFYTSIAEDNWKTDILHEVLSNPSIDLTITADDGSTLLHLLSSIDLGMEEYVENENVREMFKKCTNTLNNNCTALQCAAPSLELLTYMFEYAEPDLEHKNDLGETVLFENLRFVFNKEILEFLIEKGADVNSQNNEGNSLIFESLYSEGTEILLKAGASTQILNKKGESALHRAAQRNDLEISLLLLKYGADLELKDENNMKPSDLCSYEYMKDFLNYISGSDRSQCMEVDNEEIK